MLTVSLDSDESHPSLTGGKGHNLSILTRGGIDVPGGFVVTTLAYVDFLNQNDKKLLTKIDATLSSHADDLDEASAIIQAEFRKLTLSTLLRAEIVERLSKLDPNVNLAIRSSATCEDMQGASFAGQHDTYLNVPHAQVEKNIIECFASLFTPRAILYRNRNNLTDADAKMAVVCQCMSTNQIASGVLFTANPLTGRRNESTLEAIPGLGEALVSGITEPDRYVVARKGSDHIMIKDKRIGSKSKTVMAADGGGVMQETRTAESNEVLTEEDVKSIIYLGQTIQDLYGGAPQDIEWTKSVEGKISIVQSRPITSLFPRPNIPMDPLQVFFSFNSVQGIIAPIYPAGQEVLRKGLLGGIIRWVTWGRHGATGEFLQCAGERLFINITNILQNVLGRKILTTAMKGIDPAGADAIEELIEETGLEINSGIGPYFIIRAISLYSVILPRIITTVLFPDWMRERLLCRLDRFVDETEEKVSETRGLSELLDLQTHVLESFFPQMIPHLIPRMAAGFAPLALLGTLADDLPNGKDLVLSITRSLPNNITTEMDLKLWIVAKVIQRDKESLQHFESTDAEVLASEYLRQKLPVTAQNAVAQFTAEFGFRGLYEIDFGRPRWREEPAPIMNILKSYIEISGDNAPDKVFANGEEIADEAITALGEALNKSWLVSFLAKRVRKLAGLRELPKFTVIRLMGIIRAKMLLEGELLVSKGIIEASTDIFYLKTEEMKAMANGELTDCKGIILERKSVMADEDKRTRLPRVIASDGFAYFGGTSKIVEGTNALCGEAVSPGVYEGRIRVVHDPTKTKLNQGEVLCCHGTDPAWTPLFLSAGALVMEVGGLMTHGSVVAREYGIPAVVGLEKITERLTNGQLVRVDGSSGMIEMLD